MIVFVFSLTILAIVKIFANWTFVSDTSDVSHLAPITNHIIMYNLLFFLLLGLFLLLLLLCFFLFFQMFQEIAVSFAFTIFFSLFKLSLNFLRNILLNERLSIFIKISYWILYDSGFFHHYFSRVHWIIVEWYLIIKTQNLTLLKFILFK